MVKIVLNKDKDEDEDKNNIPVTRKQQQVIDDIAEYLYVDFVGDNIEEAAEFIAYYLPALREARNNRR